MERRAFLGVSSTALLAGCGDEQQQDVEPVNNTTESVESEPDPGPEEQAGGNAEINLIGDRWIQDQSAVEFTIQNSGSEPSGSISVIVRWYDENGYYIGQSSAGVGTLVEDSGWIGAVRPPGSFESDSYEIAVEFNSRRQSGSDTVELIDYEVQRDESVVTGLIENPTDEFASIQIQVGTYGSGGYLSHLGVESAGDVPPETTWRFLLSLRSVDYRTEQVGSETDILVRASV